MNLSEILVKRQSVRKFKNIKIPIKKIRDIIALAELAPSAGNLQSYRVKIVEGIPVVLVVCADLEKSTSKYGERGRDLYAIQDATVFASYIQLIAVDFGLSSVWIGAFKEQYIKEMLGLSYNLKPIAVIKLGYADEIPRRTKRRNLKEIIYD